MYAGEESWTRSLCESKIWTLTRCATAENGNQRLECENGKASISLSFKSVWPRLVDLAILRAFPSVGRHSNSRCERASEAAFKNCDDWKQFASAGSVVKG